MKTDITHSDSIDPFVVVMAKDYRNLPVSEAWSPKNIAECDFLYNDLPPHGSLRPGTGGVPMSRFAISFSASPVRKILHVPRTHTMTLVGDSPFQKGLPQPATHAPRTDTGRPPTPHNNNESSVMPNLFWASEAIAYLGLHRIGLDDPRAALYRLVKKGALHPKKIAGKLSFVKDDLDRLIANGDQKRLRGRPRGS